MTGPSLQCNSDHQPSRNVGAPVRENRYPRARRNGPERAEQPGLLRVGPTQSRHHGSNVERYGRRGRNRVAFPTP